MGKNTFERALAIREKAHGAEHPKVSSSLEDLYYLFVAQKRYAEAEPCLKRVVEIREKAQGDDHPQFARSLGELGALYRHQHRYAEAEPLYQRSLEISEQTLGADNSSVATKLGNLASLYEAQGRHTEAEPLLARALAIYEAAYGADDTRTAGMVLRYARVSQSLGRYTEAERLFQRVITIKQKALGRDHPGVADLLVRTAEPLAEQKKYDEAEQRLKRALAIYEAHFGNEDASVMGPLVHLSPIYYLQRRYAKVEPTARRALELAQAHFGSDSPQILLPLGMLTMIHRQRGHRRLGEALSRPTAGRGAKREARLRKELVDVETHISEVEEWLLDEFPAYVELAAPDPLRLDRVQALLRSDEAYQELFAPSESLLGDVGHVILVPDGPLQSLPMGVLVTTPPPDTSVGSVKCQDVAWLARQHAMSVLPSVQALGSLRRVARPVVAAKPFLGIGDPLLTGDPAKGRGVDAADVFTRGAVADVDRLRRLPRLPETEDELRAIAESLGGREEELYLGARATESLIKAKTDLADYRVVAFATHGLTAGEFKGLAEPALVLTPPDSATEADDGVLTSGEIARLELDADWVILSACNTAAADGTPGAEGLSGLARAFFYAGSRALLVSHWAVASDAAAGLTTRMFAERARHPGLGRAKALQLSIVAMIDDDKRPQFAHPSFWAPFVVVGEGGGRRQSSEASP